MNDQRFGSPTRTLVAVGHFDSIESRGAATASGMEKGAAEMWDRLEERLRPLR